MISFEDYLRLRIQKCNAYLEELDKETQNMDTKMKREATIEERTRYQTARNLHMGYRLNGGKI